MISEALSATVLQISTFQKSLDRLTLPKNPIQNPT